MRVILNNTIRNKRNVRPAAKCGKYWHWEMLFSLTCQFDLGCTKQSQLNCSPAERPNGVTVILQWFYSNVDSELSERCVLWLTLHIRTYIKKKEKKKKEHTIYPPTNLKLKGDPSDLLFLLYWFWLSIKASPSSSSLCHGNYLSLHCERLYHILAYLLFGAFSQEFVSELHFYALLHLICFYFVK